MQINRTRPLANLLIALMLVAVAASGLPGAGWAQGLFQPVVLVNDKAVTRFEVEQRIRLLEVLNTAGDLEQLALDGLINERVQLDAAEQFDIEITDQDLNTGIEEFGSRTNLGGQQLLDNLAGAGVDPQSFRDFVTASLAWRQLVQGLFRSKALVSQSDVDRAKAQVDPRANAEVLISEIFLPADTPENKQRAAEIADQILQITTFDAFEDAARAVSVAQSRDAGGRVPDWVPLGNLPPTIGTMFLTMSPGQVTEPLQLPNAIALFQLRGLRSTGTAAANAVVDYAAYYIAGGRSAAALQRAAQIETKINRCDDLYGIAKGQPESVLDRVSLPQSQVPADVALELAKLDANEVSLNLTRANGQTLVFLMLCSRIPQVNAELEDNTVKQALVNRRLAAYADNYLAQLRANAIIYYP